jgi:hypothetical protein
VTIRRITHADLAFMAEMLVEAAYAPGRTPKPTPDQAAADPRAGRYLRGWVATTMPA